MNCPLGQNKKSNMSFVKIWVHCVWGTKDRENLIDDNLKEILYKHVKEYSKVNDIYLDCINGASEHVHLLISLNNDQSIAKVVNLIKGESSHWINKNNLTNGKFEWAKEYFAVSVSESSVVKVREYIKNQEEHHRKKSFKEEYDEFMKKYGFEKFSPKGLS